MEDASIDTIKDVVRKVLPTLSSDCYDQIGRRLVTIGIERSSDLAFVREEDLEDLLRPIHVRKLLHTWAFTYGGECIRKSCSQLQL